MQSCMTYFWMNYTGGLLKCPYNLVRSPSCLWSLQRHRLIARWFLEDLGYIGVYQNLIQNLTQAGRFLMHLVFR